ncbi:hypothetical protein KVV02_005766 [Mortierella alpina]|uniref:DUF202 domain-containing protein n=1 Tax=Mortierella alpina TaxID=64518 RepID=A0A9P8A7S5_MORAP|nr:hypothetical protein KVV02_005766 [Mortierella alpina]
MNSDNVPLSDPSSTGTTVTYLTSPSPTHNSQAEWRESVLTAVSHSRDPSRDLILPERPSADDAIARHPYPHSIQAQRNPYPQLSHHASYPDQSSVFQQSDGEDTDASTSASNRRRGRSNTVPARSISFKIPPHGRSNNAFPKLGGCDAVDEHHGSTAYAEEEAALEHAAALVAAKAALDASKVESRKKKLSGTGVGTAESAVGASTVTAVSRAGLEEEGEIPDPHDEDDHCLSGVCLPRSQFFQTSVICSNTMTRDGLANERTFLSWLGVCVALSLVSFTFITRAFTLDAVTHGNHEFKPKDRTSIAVGYLCFVTANMASVYSLLKYLR